MTQPPALPPKKGGPKLFRRQNSFAGFSSNTLSVYPWPPPDIPPKNASLRTKTEHGVPGVKPLPKEPTTATVSIQLSTSGPLYPISKPVYSSSGNRRYPSSKVFYSLPRHSAPMSNPALLKSSASGIGLYLMSRNQQNPQKISAIQQLGVSPNKFLSLPRPIRKQPINEPVIKVPNYRSLPRPYSKNAPKELSLPSKEFNLTPSTLNNLSQPDTQDPKIREAQIRKKESDNVKYCLNNERDGSLRKRYDPNKPMNTDPPIPKENDPKYHPRSRTVVKNDEVIMNPIHMYPPYQQHPMECQYQVPPKSPDATNFPHYPVRPSHERGIVYPIYTKTESLPYYPLSSQGNVVTHAQYTYHPKVTPAQAYFRPLQTEPSSYNLPYYPTQYPEDPRTPQPQPVGQSSYYHYPSASITANVQVVNVEPPPVRNSVAPEINYRSLPRHTARNTPVSTTYQSLPRRFGQDSEFRYTTNIDISDDPGYETLRSGSRSDSSKDYISQPERSFNKHKTSDKENEPSVQLINKKEPYGDHRSAPLQLLSNAPDVTLTGPCQVPYDKTKGQPPHLPKRMNREKTQDTSKQASTYKKRDDLKYQSLPRRSRKDDTKYQSLPKRRPKESEIDHDRPPPLPKRMPREGHCRRSAKDYHASRRVVRDSQSLASKKEKMSLLPSKHGLTKRSPEFFLSQAPPSPRWDEGESDEDDGIYSKVAHNRKHLSHSSPSDNSYTKPLPPLPVPSRYRRRANEPDEAPPPLPPPRLATSSSPSNLLNNYKHNTHNETSTSQSQSSSSPNASLTNRNKAQNTAKDDDGIYSSIPSPQGASSSKAPTTLPRQTGQHRVAPSSSWDSIESSIGSSFESSRDSSCASSSRDPPVNSTTSSRRRRAVSDPRMDAGIMHKLAFTVFQTELRVGNENNNDLSGAKSRAIITRTNMRPVATSTSSSRHQTSPSKMDLVYVTERIISVVFPADVEPVTYTTNIRDVAHMLSSKHGDNFRVFDLSQDSEVARYLPRVTPLGWANGLAPPLERLCSVCKALESWLNEHPQHVALLHSRSGYEKLGVVVAAYIHYTNICASTDQALDRYAMKRFFDDKIHQLKHPSQKRYVQYFAGLLSGAIRINSSPLYLHMLTLYGVPHFESRGGCHLFFKVYQGMTPVYTSGVYNLTEAMRNVTIAFDTGIQLRGDILVKAYHRRLTPASRDVIFRIQFHTCAVSEKVLPFSRKEIDEACEDLRFPLDGGVELLFSHSKEDRPGVVSNVSCDKSPCAITAWNSYENLAHIFTHNEDHGVVNASVGHTLGPLDGSLYATVHKKRSGPPSPTLPTPSPRGTNGRYAASIDSGIASTNSVSHPPVSPPTSNSSRASGESRGTAPVAAPSPRPSTTASGSTGSTRVDAQQLDELLAGMLLDIESIPDLRPSQTPAPDINSIRCPDFGSGKRKNKSAYCEEKRVEIPPANQYTTDSSARLNAYKASTSHDSFTESSFSNNSEQVPYHARTDSKPFSYGAVTSSPLSSRHRSVDSTDGSGMPPSPSIHRKNSRETLGTQRIGLESPRLIRKMSGSVGANESGRHSLSRSPSPEPGSRGGTLRRERSHTITARIMSSDPSPPPTLNRSSLTRSAGRLNDSSDDPYSFDTSSRSMNSSNMSWLQMQQSKLQERQTARHRADRGPYEAKMLSELRTRMMQQQHHQGREFEDGYVSDQTFLSDRDSSPHKNLHPLTINTSSPQKPPISQSTGKGNSAPSSPIQPQKATFTTRQSVQSSLKNISRKHSDASYDRERPFVAVKKLHETHRAFDNGGSNCAFNQLQTSPLGHINYSTYASSSNTNDRLTTVQSSIRQGGDEWQSDSESFGANRPITPGFPPATPTTPYLNQGLPPKSPTAQRRTHLGASSLYNKQNIKRAFSLPSKDIGGLRSPSPATSQHKHDLNGHSSPAPSLYYGQSRRSSLTSLNESAEVISTHPKFVKDVSKYWYKPNISRDEAINMLRDKLPGTFVVRDSNSFPGAFGLALKVSTPPPNVTAKSSDPSNELIRHFLIEPTSRGVRLKGCANEPVFGSLSALVYQHSITSLALPCRLVLPERDPMGTNSTHDVNSNDSSQVLQQGAACNVLYLYSADTESLTGPQAVKRAVDLMLAAKSTPTVVHFKVSSQGITLTDNSRQLFFRRHYTVNTISHCGLDPDDRRWAHKNEQGIPIASLRIFGFVAKKGASRTENQCHVLAELEPEQPASAICNFVTKFMMTSANRFNLL